MKKTWIKEDGEYQQVYRAKMPEAYARVEWCKQAFGGEGEHILRPEPVISWCCRNIGGFDDWDQVGYDWWFRREQDAVLFRLRWG